MPAMVHLTRLGYVYFGKISEESAGKVYDPQTNILLEVFQKQYERLNPHGAIPFSQILQDIRNDLKNDDLGNAVRNIVCNADNAYFLEAKKLFANSQTVANRLKKYNRLDATPLYHPCPDMEQFYCNGYEDYILVPSRITRTTRQFLALQALAETKTDVRLYILGKADHVAEKEKLTTYVKEHHLEERVRFLDYVSQEEKFKLYAEAKAVLFIPKEEDYGYITLEAMASSKPVITATDSGGPLEFIRDHQNGIIAQPTAKALAEAMDEVWNSKTMAEEYGTQARKTLDEMDITWDRVIKELIEA